jgi:hypothetical protein
VPLGELCLRRGEYRRGVTVPPRELERLLGAAVQDPAERPAFTSALMESEVLVLGSTDRRLVDGVAPQGTSIQLVHFTDDEGAITPFFTSESMIGCTLAARPGTSPDFLRLRSRDLFEMAKGSRLVLNPDGPHRKIYLPAEVAALAAREEPGMFVDVVESDREVLVGAAKSVPRELPEVLSRYLVQRPVVRAAHLGWIVHPDGHHGYLMVVVANDREAAMAGFGSVQIGEVTGGNTLDVIVVPPGSDGHVLSAIPPFYSRQPQPDLPARRRRGMFRRRD